MLSASNSLINKNELLFKWTMDQKLAPWVRGRTHSFYGKKKKLDVVNLENALDFFLQLRNLSNGDGDGNENVT